MVFSRLTSRFSTRSEKRPAAQSPRFRPTLEQLEAREVPSANPMGDPLNALLGSSPGIVPLQLNFITGGQMNQAGQLQFTAHGQVGAMPVNLPLTITASPGSNGAEILDLHLSPIHLDVLGLNVQTSNICLDVTAQQGSGNLLGNVLYSVAHALDPNTGNSSNPLGAPNSINHLLFSLEVPTLLNGGLNAATAYNALGASSAAANDQTLPPGANDILHLSVGPVNLNLLGLNVALDNCNNGPVVVDVYTQPGQGELLGNLLTEVSNALNPSGSNLQAEQLLGNVVNSILTAV
jgi:hypothetical protein